MLGGLTYAKSVVPLLAGEVVLVNSTFYDNEATTTGGVMKIEGGSVTILSSNFSANRAGLAVRIHMLLRPPPPRINDNFQYQRHL